MEKASNLKDEKYIESERNENIVFYISKLDEEESIGTN
jgi:hypothetical protein